MSERYEDQPWLLPGVAWSATAAYGSSSSCSTSFQFGTSFSEGSGNSGSNRNAGRMMPGGADPVPVVIGTPGWAPAGNTGPSVTARTTTWVSNNTGSRLDEKRLMTAPLCPGYVHSRSVTSDVMRRIARCAPHDKDPHLPDGWLRLATAWQLSGTRPSALETGPPRSAGVTARSETVRARSQY